MSDTKQASANRDPVIKFFSKVFRLPPEDFKSLGERPMPGMPAAGEHAPKMSAVMGLQNVPEFWADAPWRLEPDQDTLPISFHVNDARIQPPGKGPWRLHRLLLDQQVAEDTWYPLSSFLPAQVPQVDANGDSLSDWWVFGTSVPVDELQGVPAGRGATVHLRARFEGSYPPHTSTEKIDIHLETFLAAHGLPMGRAALPGGSRKWFFGDTHYHSGYTHDLKEFGGAVQEARRAGQAIGLDWLVITDHSCDLDEVDEGAGGKSRWARLKADLASPAVSDDTFRCIQGEEVTLLSHAGKPVHMLVMGGLDELIEGAFLPSHSKNAAMNLTREAIETIIAAGRGYGPTVLQQLFGRMHRLDEILAALPAGTLAFAAHPFDVAQIPPGRWGEKDLTHPRLTGYEFWNGRVRVSTMLTRNPFAVPDWKDRKKLAKGDIARRLKFCDYAAANWDPQLKRGVDGWPIAENAPAWRPVMLGGSDAHGDFNYHVGLSWDYRTFMADDSAFARVRTAAYLPNYTGAGVPPADDLLAALKRGSCVVTDGPIVEMRAQHGGHVAQLGEVLLTTGPADVEVQVASHTTPELGPVERIELVTYWKDQSTADPRRITVPAGGAVTVEMEGVQGYCRVEAGSTGPNGESFYCFTNPIWIRSVDAQARRMRISFN